MKVLFVCTGNTCRSPMAEAILADVARRRGLDVEVVSAGTAAPAGGSVAPEAAAALEEIGLAHPTGRTRPIDDEAVSSASLVLVMERRHLEGLAARFPAARAKIRLLTEYAGDVPGDVGDPYGLSLDEYRRCRDRLRDLVERAADRLDRAVPARAGGASR